MPDTFDVIVIGAGPPGENAAGRCADAGLSVAIVESRLVGGECSDWACMPSKTLLRSGALLRAAQKVGGTREAITGDLDVAAVLKRRISVKGDLQPLIERMRYKGIADRVFAALKTEFIDDR